GLGVEPAPGAGWVTPRADGASSPQQKVRPVSLTHDWIRTPLTADVVRGALELEASARGVQPHRLPAWARAQGADAQLAMVESQPAGVRLAFRTAATVIELDTLPTRYSYVGAPARPDGVYDLVVDGV